MSHVKLIAKTSVYICHKNVKSMGFLQFFESFRGKIYKKYSIGNEEWTEFETETITSNSVEHNHLSISKLSCRQNECTHTRKKRTVLLFFFNSKDTKIFPKLLF